MIPNRKQDPRGMVRGVKEGARQGHSGASSEDPYDTNVWGSTEEWDKAVSMAHSSSRGSSTAKLVELAKTQVQINRGKKPRNANHTRHMSVQQFGGLPLSDVGSDITAVSDGTGDGAGV